MIIQNSTAKQARPSIMKTKHFDIDHRKKAKRLKMDAEELMMESDGEEKESLDEEVEMNEAEEEVEEEEVDASLFVPNLF